MLLWGKKMGGRRGEKERGRGKEGRRDRERNRVQMNMSSVGKEIGEDFEKTEVWELGNEFQGSWSRRS